jgi:uncharacterized Fe-S center protein
MGKKSRTKHLRKLAESLPGISQNSCFKQQCDGAELIKDGVKIVNEKPVDPEGKYIKRVPVAIEVNHTRRLKNAFLKHGHAGVSAYVRSVENFAKQQQQTAQA